MFASARQVCFEMYIILPQLNFGRCYIYMIDCILVCFNNKYIQNTWTFSVLGINRLSQPLYIIISNYRVDLQTFKSKLNLSVRQGRPTVNTYSIVLYIVTLEILKISGWIFDKLVLLVIWIKRIFFFFLFFLVFILVVCNGSSRPLIRRVHSFIYSTRTAR